MENHSEALLASAWANPKLRAKRTTQEVCRGVIDRMQTPTSLNLRNRLARQMLVPVLLRRCNEQDLSLHVGKICWVMF